MRRESLLMTSCQRRPEPIILGRSIFGVDDLVLDEKKKVYVATLPLKCYVFYFILVQQCHLEILLC